MNPQIKKYFGQFKFLRLQDFRLLFSTIKIKRVKKGEVIINAGEINKLVLIVLKGLLRTYVIMKDSDEVTVLFTPEGKAVGSYASILLNKESNENIEAIEDSTIAFLDSAAIEKVVKNYPNLLYLQNKILKLNLAEAVERIHFYTLFSPEERFINFREKNPSLINRVPQKYLASFLGITTVSLSRIKSRVMKS